MIEAVIPLNGAARGLSAIISAERLDLVAGKKWYRSTNGYVVTSDGKYLHRVVTGAKPGQHVDHRNRDKLDNRDENLRVCTKKQNCRNAKKKKYSRQPFKGIGSNTPGKFFARIRVDGKAIHLGTFDTSVEAARAYDKAARELHGEFAGLNFPGEQP